MTKSSVIVTTENQNDHPIVTQTMTTKDIHHYSKRFSSLSSGCSKCNLPNQLFTMKNINVMGMSKMKIVWMIFIMI